jgi:hypothetical protein
MVLRLKYRRIRLDAGPEDRTGPGFPAPFLPRQPDGLPLGGGWIQTVAPRHPTRCCSPGFRRRTDSQSVPNAQAGQQGAIAGWERSAKTSRIRCSGCARRPARPRCQHRGPGSGHPAAPSAAPGGPGLGPAVKQHDSQPFLPAATVVAPRSARFERVVQDDMRHGAPPFSCRAAVRSLRQAAVPRSMNGWNHAICKVARRDYGVILLIFCPAMETSAISPDVL